jgi:hypothetical protein
VCVVVAGEFVDFSVVVAGYFFGDSRDYEDKYADGSIKDIDEVESAGALDFWFSRGGLYEGLESANDVVGAVDDGYQIYDANERELDFQEVASFA